MGPQCRAQLLTFVVIFAQFLITCNGIAVMSVDLGSEWMKVAIVSPGVPMEIALNKESKRKTPVAVAFRDGERCFGEDASSLGVRFPANTYTYLPLLLGQKVDSPAARLYMKRFPYHKIVPDPERGTVVFQHDSETQYSVEELLGMLLEVARNTAQAAAGDKHVVKEAVITVPGHWGQAERRSLIVAAQLSGIRVLQLISDHMAVALNYGIFRRKDFNETVQYIMFYDMGASSTTATIASYQLVKSKERGFLETNPQVSIIGLGGGKGSSIGNMIHAWLLCGGHLKFSTRYVGREVVLRTTWWLSQEQASALASYDRTLGGLEMQLRLRDFLARKFNEMGKTKTDVFSSPRALAKLFKEAGRLKNVLSANPDHYAQVEGLLEDIDFKLHVTRDQLQDLCEDLFDRVKGPIDRALKSSGLTMDVISQVILVGAGTRVPKVQEVLAKAVGMDLGKSLNTDEAAAMGAVYRAADLSAGFKVKKFITKDAALFPIQVVFEREVESEESSERKGIKTVRRMLFGSMNPYPQKKILTFNKHTNDFVFYVSEAVPETDHLPEDIQIENESGYWTNLTEIHVSGVGSGLKKTIGPGVESKGVKAHFAMDDSGILSLLHAELMVEKTLSAEEAEEQEKTEMNTESPLSKLGSTISKLFSGGEEKEGEGKGGVQKEGSEGRNENANEAMNEDEKQGKEVNKNTTKAGLAKKKVVVIKEKLEILERRLDVADLEGKKLGASIDKIKSLNDKDNLRSRTEGAMNSLESFVFDLQMKLDSEDYSSASTAEEIEGILKECSQVSDWISDDGAPGMGAKAEDYESRLSSLQKLAGPLLQRVAEHKGRPEAIRSLNSLVEAAEAFIKGTRITDDSSAENKTNVAITEVELDTLEKLISATKEWKKRMEDEQSQLPLSVAPKLTLKAIADKMVELHREVKYLVNKIEIWKANKAKEINAAKDVKENNVDNSDSEQNETSVDNDGPQEPEDPAEEVPEEPLLSIPSEGFLDDAEVPSVEGNDDASLKEGVDGDLEEENAHGEL